MPQVTGQGTEVTLENTIKAPFTKFDIEGNSEQDGEPTPESPVEVKSCGENVNEYEGSQDFSGTWNNSSYWETDDNTYNGCVVKKRKGSWNGISKDISVKEGETYTFSVYIKSDESRQVAIYTSNGTSGIDLSKNITTTSDWVRYSLTFIATASGTVRLRVENISASDTNYTYIAGYKLEQGTVATPWSPYGMGSINEKIKNADGTEEQDYSIFVQQPMRSIGDVRDGFAKVNGVWNEKHLPYIASYNGETLPTDVYTEEGGIKYCNSKSMSTTGQFSNGASVQYVDENNWNYLPCTPEQIQQLENLPSTYKDFTIIQSQDETPAYLEVSGIYDLNNLINN